MKVLSMIMLALLLACSGCDQQAADRALDKARAAEARAAADAKLAEDQHPLSESNVSEAQDSDSQLETISKLDANQVLHDAIAAAKADNKALLVHFSADW